MEYRYADSEATPWADMFPTSVLNDGSAGDTATGETLGDTATQTTDPYCGFVEAQAVLVAQVFLTNAHTLTSARFVGGTSAVETVGNACLEGIEPTPPQVPGTASWTIYRSSDGESWVEIDSGGLAAPDLTGIPPYAEDFDETVALSESACWVRLVLENHQNAVGANGSVAASIYLSDFRITGTDSGSPCEDPDPEPEPEPEPGEGDCTCSWTEAAPATDGFTETAPVSTTHTEAAPLASSFTRRTCP